MASLTTTMATSPSTAATVAAAAAAAMKHSSSSAVDVESLSFSYKRHGLNLESINMHVPRGTIYGLLGPSGCGKTTLLRCIVGRLKPRCGNVSVFGYCPGTKECGIPGPNIGYMPQELSLISQFTVRETLEYYAGFAKQTSRMQTLESRIEFLLKLLDISDFEHCYTDRLSGGQQRRVSLAVAMINDPPLLILDEPTVGVDPIVRESIWSYLVDQSKNGLTVIVTTHYIEEAGSADKVGFMRQGRILAEGNPNDLMMEHGVVSMERLFLKLSQQDDFRHSNNTSQLENGSSFTKDILLTLDSQKNHKIINMNHHNHILHNNYVMGNGGSPTIAATIEPTNQSVMYTSNGGASMMAFVNSGKNKPNLFSHLATPPINNAVKHMIVHEQYKQLDPDSLIETNTISGNNCKLNNNDYNNQMDASSDSPLFNNNSSSSSSSSTSSTRSKKSNHSSSGRNNNTNKKVRTYSVHNQDRSVNSVQKVGVLCRKHRIRLFRRVPELVITMLLPALEVALFCLCMGRDPTSVQMAVCNQEDPPFLSLMFLKSIDSDFISLKYYRTPEEAIDSVRNADTYSAIVLGKNFSNVLNRFGRIGSGMPPGLGRLPPNIAQQQTVATSTSIEPPIGYTQSNGKLVTNTNEPVPPLMTPYIAPSQPTQSMLKTSSIIVNDNDDYDSENEDNPERKRFKRDISDLLTTTAVTSTPDSNLITPDDDDSIIRIYYDGSNALHVNIIRREVFSALFKFVENAGKIFGGQMSSIKLPIKFEKPIYGGEKTDMVEFVGPGLMVFIVFFATMSITSMAFLSERREGTLERSMIVGMTPTEFIIAQIINITILLIVQIILTVVMGFWIFDFPMKGSYVLAVAMMFLQGLCGMTFGLMLSAICTSEMTALALGAGSQLMFCFITGIFWPVETMIALLRYISYAMPQTKPMESFRHILIRGFDLSKPAVLNGYLITMAWIAFFLILAIVIFRVR